MGNVRLTVSVDADDLVREMDRDDLVDMITDIDSGMQDWNFTLLLALHFEKLHQAWHAEAKDHYADDTGCKVCAVSK